MNFDFSEQQKLIQTEARKFLQQQCPTERVRGAMENQTTDDELWQAIIELGWTGLAIPDTYGGLGLGELELCVLSQESGRAMAPLPLVSCNVFARAITRGGSDQQKQRLLPKLASGELIGTLALSERVGDSFLDQPVSLFDNGLISGKKIAVVDGLKAHFVILNAINPGGEYALYLVDLRQAAVRRDKVNAIDPSRPLALLTFTEAVAEPLSVEGKSGRQLIAELMNFAVVICAFEQIGGCEAALDMGIAYTRQRYAFGRPVASFQAIKHKFADMFVAKEIATANAWYAAWALQSGSTELPLAAATARVSAIDAYFLCSKENLQAHGGMGYTWEFDCHLHYRRAQHLSLIFGGSSLWKEQINHQLLDAQEKVGGF